MHLRSRPVVHAPMSNGQVKVGAHLRFAHFHLRRIPGDSFQVVDSYQFIFLESRFRFIRIKSVRYFEVFARARAPTQVTGRLRPSDIVPHDRLKIDLI